MNQYVTGAIIRKIREEHKMTQLDLAEKLNVSDKTISKWETGKGYPDITMLESLANALNISLIELMSGNDVVNRNRSSNMKRGKFYVCPICGNVIFSIGEAVISCCGITLPPMEVETTDESHELSVSVMDGEFYVNLNHEMNKSHNISFIAAVYDDRCDIVKLYPEGSCEARFPMRGMRRFYAYCNHHGLFCTDFYPKRK